jgi:hypothetical protein
LKSLRSTVLDTGSRRDPRPRNTAVLERHRNRS